MDAPASDRAARPESRRALLLVGAYAGLSALWILVSDRLLAAWLSTPAQMAVASAIKGWVFVAVSAALLFAALRRWNAAAPVSSTVGETAPRPWLPLLLVLAVVLPATVAGVALSLRQDRDDLLQRMAAVAHLKAQELGNWLEEREIDAALVITGAEAPALAARWQAGDEAALRQLLARLPALLVHTRFSSATVFDAQGQARAALPGAPAAEAALAGARAQAAQQRRLQRLGPYLGADGQPQLDVLVPLAGPAATAGAPVPLLALHLSGPAHLPARLAEWPVPTSTGELVLVRRDGADVVYLSTLRHAPQAGSPLRRPMADQSQLAAQLLAAHAAVEPQEHLAGLSGLAQDGSAALGVGRAVPGTDWYVLAQMDRAELLEAALPQAVWITLTGVLLMAAAGAATFWLRGQQQLLLAARAQKAQHERLEALGLLHAIVDTTAEGVIATDLTGQAMLRNPAAQRMLGRGAPMALDEALRAASEGVRTSGLELWPAGGMTVVLADVAPLNDAAGQRTGAFAVLRDVTAMKQAEAALQRRARRAQAQLLLPMQAENVSEAEFIELALAQAEDLTGSTQAFLHFVHGDGETVEMVAWSARTRAACTAQHETHYPISRAGLWADACRQRRPVLINDYAAARGRSALPEGHAPLQRMVAAPVVEGGRVTMLLGVGGKPVDYDEMDVESVQLMANQVWRLVQHRRTMDELRKLQQAVEQSVNSIVITNLRAEIEYVNQAFVDITGYAREEVLGRNPRILHPAGVAPGTRASMWEELTQGRPWQGEFVNRRKDGSEYVELAHIAPLRQADGRITHYVGVKEDITEKTRIAEELDRYRQRLEELVEERTAALVVAQQRAEAASQAKSAFLANMSHEIRTPMNAIIGLSYLLRKNRPTPAQEAWLAKIDAAALHLLDIINSILDLSKIEAGKLALEAGDFAPRRVLEQVAALITDRAQAKGVAVHVEDEGLPAWLHGDATRLRQALLNYADNALKFTATGSITLRGRCLSCDEQGLEDGLLLRFEVQDTGVGVDAEVLPRLFQAFEQADASTTRRFGGTGLGLALTRQLARLMGGEAGADSVSGQGSTFWFTARLRACHTPPPMPPVPDVAGAEAALRQRCAGARVLLVEDEAVNREVALELLRDTGLQVDTAVNGVEALERLRERPYDIVLMDLQMPRMDGFETTRALRADPALRALPVVAMTASAFDDARTLCREAGMDDFVPKPVEPRLLHAALLRWLPQREGARIEAPAPAPDGSAARALLATLDGVDLQRGLLALRGDADSYLRLLRSFVQLHRDDPAQVSAALAAGDAATARTLLHRVVGAAGTLGLVRVHGSAAQLGNLLRQQPDAAGAGALAATLQEHMQALVSEVERWPVAEPAQAQTTRGAGLEPVLQELQWLLDTDDIEALERFTPHRQALQARFGDEVARLAQELEGFDFPAARETLARLRQRAAGR